MKSFTDTLGRTWTLVVNVATLKRVRVLCGADLNCIIEVEDGKPETRLLEKLSTDPVLLVDFLYAVCKPECDRKKSPMKILALRWLAMPLICYLGAPG